jgi:hypothetical protein
MRTTLVVAAAAVLGSIAVPAPAPAAAAKDGDVLVRGTCTARSAAKLKLGEENGRIEVEFEVDQNRNGVTWTVVLRRNGRPVVTLTRLTRSPSGSFEVRRIVADGPGVDVVSARAARRSGEVCTARASFRA